MALLVLTAAAYGDTSGSTSGGAMAVEDLRFLPSVGIQPFANAPINGVAQDRRGYMWFGTQNGLARYDGFHITVYRGISSDAHSLADDWVLSVHLDRLGNLWVGTLGGLQRYDETTDSFVRYLPTGAGIEGPDLVIQTVIDDGEDGLWIGTAGSLQHLDIKSGNIVVMRHDPNDPHSLGFVTVGALARDSVGNLWIGGVGLDRLPAGSTKFEHRQTADLRQQGQSAWRVKQMLIDRRDTLWVASFKALDAWDLKADIPRPKPIASIDGIAAEDVHGMLEDYAGNLWISTDHNGAIFWDRNANTFRHYRHDAHNPYSIATNGVSLFLDRTGTLWTSAVQHGVQRADLSSGGFTHIAPMRSGADESSPGIIDILEGPEHKLWLAARGVGILLLDPVTGQFTNLLDGPLKPLHITADSLTSMARDPQGTLWIATLDRLIEYDPTSQKVTLRLPRGEQAMPKRAGKITVGRDGTIWLASYVDGLYHFDPQSGNLENLRHDPADPRSLTDDSVWTLMEDHEGTVWVGGISGVSRLDRTTGHFTLYRNDPRDPGSIAKGNVTALFEDSSHTLWVGNDAGLNQALPKADGTLRFRFFPTDDHVDAIREDKQDRLWISTDVGIYNLDRTSMTLKNYNTESGGLLEGGYYFESACAASDGTLYFGGEGGLTAFRPDDIRRNPFPPPVAISDFQVLNQSVRGTDGPPGFHRTGADAVTLNYDIRVFSIGFSALHYADPERNQYAYRLEGFDKDWISTSPEKRLATYTNLDPGHYVFRVKAANKDGVWNENGASLDITIEPPFWRTWWFRLLVSSLLGGIAVLGYRNRISGLVRQKSILASHVAQRTVDLSESNAALADANRRLGERQSELTRFLAVASHDLRQPVQALNLYLGALAGIDDVRQMRPLLGKVHRCAQILDDMFSALLDISRLDAKIVTPENEIFPISSVMSKLSLEFAPQAQAKGLQFFVPNSAHLVQSDPALVGQILQNLLANAVRYTRHGHISLTCRRHGDRLRVAVEDTGIGISPEQQKKVFDEFVQLGDAPEGTKGLGLGLAIVKRLCNLLDVPIALESTFARGSVFSIDLPLAGGLADEPDSSERAARKNDVLGGKLIVSIDDDERICDAMAALLASWGCEVIAATSTKAAFAELRSAARTPDMIVCDYRLADDETGADAIERLRAGFGWDIPAVLITGNTAEQLAGDAKARGLPILYKPVPPDLLHNELVAQLILVARKASQA